MIRTALFLSAVALAFGQSCNTPTCYKCQQMSGCGWYTAGPLANCYATTSVPSGLNFTLTANGSCATCQAGNCLDCIGSPAGAGVCGWYANSIGALGGTCGLSNSTPPTPVGSYKLVSTTAGSCPACTSYTTCSTCTAQETNQTCGWYTLAGVTSGTCAEASPGYLYSKTSAAFCNGNICAGAANCTLCLAQNANETGACAWYIPATTFLASLYNPKCDINSTGIVNNALYNSTATCPPCQDATCTACLADTNCQWLALTVLGQSEFGQCVTSGTTVTGKSNVAVCPATCQLYSCAQCVVATGCEWFTTSGTAASGLKDTCDRTSDAYLHPISTIITTAATCPACRSTRCYECDTETNPSSTKCGWYAATLGGHIIPGTDACYPSGMAPSLSPTLIPSTDSRCAGNPNSAAVALPGLALLAFLLV